MIYWDTDDGIKRADMNNASVSQMEDFATGQADDPEGVSIDPVTGYVFGTHTMVAFGVKQKWQWALQR